MSKLVLSTEIQLAKKEDPIAYISVGRADTNDYGIMKRIDQGHLHSNNTYQG
jgi:hypothetical protein